MLSSGGQNSTQTNEYGCGHDHVTGPVLPKQHIVSLWRSTLPTTRQCCHGITPVTHYRRIFMVDLEEKAIAGAGEDIAPSVWKRYVDDILSLVKRDKGQLLVDHLNKQHEKIRFTMEEERDGSLPFTDISFSRDEYGQVVREVYRKQHTPIGTCSLPLTILSQWSLESLTAWLREPPQFPAMMSFWGKSWTRLGKRWTRTIIQSTLWRRQLKKEWDEEKCHAYWNKS